MFQICYLLIAEYSGKVASPICDIFEVMIKSPRQSPIDLQKEDFLILSLLSYTKEGQFFHAGIFNGSRKIFWLIITALPHYLSRLQSKTNLEKIYTLTEGCWSLHQLQNLHDKCISNLPENESKIINFILFRKLRLSRPR